MSETTKHTPGPWVATRLQFDRPEPTEKARAIGYVTDCIEGGGDEFFAVLCEKPDGTADVCHTGNGPTSEANARLIAAAPEMLEALKESAGWFLSGFIRDRALAVIAKAEGRSDV